MQDKIEKLKKDASDYDVTALIDKPGFLDKIIEMTINGEDIDEVILDLFESGFDELSGDFDSVESLSEKECLHDIAESGVDTGADNKGN